MTRPSAEVKSAQPNYLTKQEVEKRVQNGQILIIYNNKVYKLNKWIKYHPGGELAIINMIGKDATDAINVLHPDYVVNNKIHNFYIGEYELGDSEENMIHSQTSTNESEQLLTVAKEMSISVAFRRLESKIKERGLTTMDVDCPWWMDWFHGGLQFQTIHHLFPRVPRHNLRSCQSLVKEFCDEVGIKYHIYGFVKGNGVVLGALKDVANQVKLLKTVAKGNHNKSFITED
ncbi:2251_t:CDS:2 [Cetraspora pellucida]|uniref:2251_t:CDS:1 n=1 Tax=Cetraspora pellucida TaxID=1433469 RepID=A0ACA9LKK7_9GLOM|nr:2251_t:CDS:2 [Cetraspora pellucida]